MITALIIIGYLAFGVVVSGCLVADSHRNVSRVDNGEDYFVYGAAIFFWPLFLVFFGFMGIGWLIGRAVK